MKSVLFLIPFNERVFLNSPSFTKGEATVRSLEKLGGFRVTLELPLEPGCCDDGEFTAMGTVICPKVADRIVGGKCGNLHEPVEVVHAVFVQRT